MANDYEVCPECNFGAMTSQLKKSKGICPSCKKWNVLKDKAPTDAEVAEVKAFRRG